VVAARLQLVNYCDYLMKSVDVELPRESKKQGGERDREFYSQLHCRHTRRAISPSELVPMLSNT